LFLITEVVEFRLFVAFINYVLLYNTIELQNLWCRLLNKYIHNQTLTEKIQTILIDYLMLIQDISVRKINLWSLEDWMMDEKSTLLGLFFNYAPVCRTLRKLSTIVGRPSRTFQTAALI